MKLEWDLWDKFVTGVKKSPFPSIVSSCIWCINCFMSCHSLSHSLRQEEKEVEREENTGNDRKNVSWFIASLCSWDAWSLHCFLILLMIHFPWLQWQRRKGEETLLEPLIMMMITIKVSRVPVPSSALFFLLSFILSLKSSLSSLSLLLCSLFPWYMLRIQCILLHNERWGNNLLLRSLDSDDMIVPVLFLPSSLFSY